MTLLYNGCAVYYEVWKAHTLTIYSNESTNLALIKEVAKELRENIKKFDE